MKVRLVRLLTMSPQETSSSSTCSVLFLPPYAFLCPWMPPERSEIHHSIESDFVSVSLFTQIKERSSRSPKELFKFLCYIPSWNILEHVQVTELQVIVIWLIALTALNNGAFTCFLHRSICFLWFCASGGGCEQLLLRWAFLYLV